MLPGSIPGIPTKSCMAGFLEILNLI